MLFLTLLAACGTSNSQINTDDSCKTTVDVVASDDTSLGFSASEVVSLLQSNLPTSVVWDVVSPGAVDAAVTMSVDAVAGDIAIVHNAPEVGACRAEPGLRVPLGVTITVDEGDLVAAGTLAVDATSLSMDAVYPFSDLGMLPVELAGDYMDELASHIAAGQHAEDTVESVGLYGVGPWGAGEISVEVNYEQTGVESVWRGHWSVPIE